MKHYLLLICTLLSFGQGFSQCTPNPSYTDPGFYPDSATGIATAQIGVQYEEVITVVLPADTMITLPGVGPVDLTIDSIIVDSICIVLSGDTVPFSAINFTYATNFPTGQHGCIRISGIPPAFLNGNYTLAFYTTLNVTHPLLGSFPMPEQAPILYTLTVEDPLGIITGNIYNDINGNCIRNGGEGGLAHRLVVANPGNHYSFTNSVGDYALGFTAAGTYSVTHFPAQYWENTCPNPGQSHTVTITSGGNTISGINFGDTLVEYINDLRVVLTNGTPARPGFPVTYHLTVSNAGTTNRSGVLNFQYDNSLAFNSSTPVHDNSSANTLSWNFGPLAPENSLNYSVTFTLNPNTVLGTFLELEASVTPSSDDVRPSDNLDSLSQIVQGSYDPNDKAVLPSGPLSEYHVSTQVPLTYTIRFQNTGTDTAFTVVIRDTLSAGLVMETFEVLASSHPVTWTVSYPQMVTWTFTNILLPDSNVNEQGSHGFIKYRIRPKTTLNLGEEIRNTAYIYFDFNQPVVTNTTITPISNEGAAVNEMSTRNAVQVFPNPADNYITFVSELSKGIFQVKEITGKLLLSSRVQSEKFGLDISSLSTGVYFITISDANTGVWGKFVKQ